MATRKMRRAFVSSFFVWNLNVCLANAQADSLDLLVELTPEPSAEIEDGVVVRRESDGTAVTGVNIVSKKKYQVKIGKSDLSIPLLIEYTSRLPPGYDVGKLNFDAPFYETGSTINVMFSPVSVKADAADVRALFAIDLSEQSNAELLKVYQKARSTFLIRAEQLNSRWDQLHDYDVQAAYKYLEAANLLAVYYHFLPGNDVAAANDWMKQAINNKRSRVAHALGNVGLAKTLVGTIDAAKSVRFSLIWREIKDVPSYRDRLALLESYRAALVSLPQIERAKVINATGVSIPNIESAIAQCVANLAKADPQSEVWGPRIDTQIIALEAARGTSDEGERARLNSDIQVLKNLKEYLATQTP